MNAMYADRLRAAMQVPTPALPIRAGLDLGLRTRARLLRHLGRPRTVGIFENGIVTTSHPDGYEINRLGPAGGSGNSWTTNP